MYDTMLRLNPYRLCGYSLSSEWLHDLPQLLKDQYCLVTNGVHAELWHKERGQ